MIQKKQTVSVIVPVYNEIDNIKLFHQKLVDALSAHKYIYEIIYIDDRSTDGTYEWLKTVVAQDKNSVSVFLKAGQQGKAFSLMEGFARAKGEVFVMIDGDLQYPPEQIPAMVERLKSADVVVANRKEYNDSFFRRVISNTFRFGFGKLFFGLSCDIQAGLKVFTREVFETVKFIPNSPWAIDLELLYRARQAGFHIENFDITFAPRTFGESKVNVFKAAYEIGSNALLVKTKKIKPLIVPPAEDNSMRGAGIGYQGKKYITHTTLPFSLSALQTFSGSQKFFIFFALLTFVLSLIRFPLLTMQVTVTVLSILYFVDAVFSLFILSRSLKDEGEIHVTTEEIKLLDSFSLPIYSILCPLYKEAHVVPQFLKGIEQLDWPKDKLDVMFLLEEDDEETIEAIQQMELPSFARIVVVPHSMPKTKPKACNYGLAFARGEYLVIFDAEDVPDPLQLKKAYIGFHKVPNNVKCLQAKLNYYNSRQNLVTRFFTAEYSLWFDLTLTGLQSLNSALPLGGTSNHFKTESIRELQGWDPFNVTEDADLGIRLFQNGYKTAIIESTTLEEATSNVKNWLRQRSRWIKGYMQTYLVHMRNAPAFIKKRGLFHQFIFQLTVGGKLLFILLNPSLWIITILYFVAFPIVGPTIEKIYVPPFSYIAVVSWIFGNFLFLYSYMIGVGKRKQWDIMKYVLAIPLYWVMMSISAVIALQQLIFKPHYWEKTIHGFHLGGAPTPVKKAKAPEVTKEPLIQPAFEPAVSRPRSRVIWQAPSRKVVTATLARWSSVIALLVFDIVLAKYFLPEPLFTQYFMLSLFGKALFVISQVGAHLVTTLFVNNKQPEAKFYNTIFFTFLFSWIGFVTFGLEGIHVDARVFGNAVLPIIPYMSFYIFAFLCFAVANVIITFNKKKQRYTFSIISTIIIALQVAFLSFNHEALDIFVKTMAFLGTLNLMVVIGLQINSELVRVLENNVLSILGLFKDDTSQKAWHKKQMKILIFNWRDTKHIYAGGAEVYIYELAKRWVQEGNKVTLFCGNDNNTPSNEVVDGIQVVRRGGVYTVYLFAFIYYMLHFSEKYDVIIDCENGVPFFTPLFSRKPIVLLIHHVHQEVFRAFLQFPLKNIAAFLEAKFMPLVYKNKLIVTVSESSRQEIVKLPFANNSQVEIIPNGVSNLPAVNYAKTSYPSFVYLGRLKKYKNIDVAIKAMAEVVKIHPEAKFSIVGYGENYPNLKKLVSKLNLDNAVNFLGKVSEEQKAKILAESWVALQPSQLEGWGITVIEANSVGTPVIASRVNGLQDSVVDGQTGLLVDVGNVAQFTQAMTMMIEDAALRERLSLEAINWSKNFSWDKSADTFYQLIGRSLNASPLPAYPAYLPSTEK